MQKNTTLKYGKKRYFLEIIAEFLDLPVTRGAKTTQLWFLKVTVVSKAWDSPWSRTERFNWFEYSADSKSYVHTKTYT